MNSWLLEFRFNPDIFNNEEVADKWIGFLSKAILKCTGDMKVAHEDKNYSSKDFTIFYKRQNECSALVQGMKNGLLCIDIHANNTSTFGNQEVEEARDRILKLENIFRHRTLEFSSLPALKRGLPFSSYDHSTLNTISEYDFSEVVFDENSEFQNIRIMHSPQYGNCLFLDNDINLSESDLAYTVAITGNNRENYEGKNVLILGGGDGGILNYLLNCELGRPNMITMIDIDGMVIEAARKHLRGICGNSLDECKGENYEVIVGDCVEYLKGYVKAGRKFDFVINDLTAIPISSSPVGSHWDFLRLILSLSMDVLKDSGKYFTQGNGSNNVEALQMYEKQFEKLKDPVSFSKEKVCVPSYLEMWIFYTLWKSGVNGFV